MSRNFNFCFMHPCGIDAENMVRIISTYRPENLIFNQDALCPTEKFIKVGTPMSLLNTCLKYLHINFCVKLKFEDNLAVNFNDVPKALDALPLPLELKKKLLEMLIFCPRHCRLRSLIVPSQKIIHRYYIKRESPLYEVMTINNIDQGYIDKLWILARLIDFILDLELKPFYSDNYGAYENYVKQNTERKCIPEFEL